MLSNRASKIRLKTKPDFARVSLSFVRTGTQGGGGKVVWIGRCGQTLTVTEHDLDIEFPVQETQGRHPRWFS